MCFSTTGRIQSMTRKMWLNVLAVLAVLAFVAAAIFIPVSFQSSGGEGHPKVSPALCHGEGCNGFDPIEFHCDSDAGPINEKWLEKGVSLQVQVLYSPSCGAAWGMIQHAQEGDIVDISIPDLKSIAMATATVETGHTTKHTTMLPFDTVFDSFPIIVCGTSKDKKVCVETDDTK
jgi:hypothetical protein